MKSKNLWGELKDLKKVPSPKARLKEQVDNLSNLTEGMLTAEIAKGILFTGYEFTYTIVIIAPWINNYKKTILEVGHNMEPYPLRLMDFVNDKNYECNNEPEFLKNLEEILTSPKVRDIIASLISYST